MKVEIEAFVSEWMRRNSHVIEEIVFLQGDDATTPYGASLNAYLKLCCETDHRQEAETLTQRPGFLDLSSLSRRC